MTVKSHTILHNNQSGTTGVSWNSHSRKWVATIQRKGVRKYLGEFAIKKDAVNARKHEEAFYKEKGFFSEKND
jgi:hypothetical protein